MEEADVVTDQGRFLEQKIGFDTDHGNRVVQDHGVQSMESVWWKAVQADRNDGDDGSHVQDVFGRRFKTRGLIYPGNYPERVTPKVRAELRPESRKATGGVVGEENGLFY